MYLFVNKYKLLLLALTLKQYLNNICIVSLLFLTLSKVQGKLLVFCFKPKQFINWSDSSIKFVVGKI